MLIDWSKYAGLKDVWDMHPSNTEGSLYNGTVTRTSDQQAETLREYTSLNQQLSDDLGGDSELVTEAMLALGGLGSSGLNLENLGNPDYYTDMIKRRGNYIDQGHSEVEADSIPAYRTAAILTGQKKPDLGYIESQVFNKKTQNWGDPLDKTYSAYRQSGGISRDQLQGMFSQANQQQVQQVQQMQQPINMYQTTSELFHPEIQKFKESNTQRYLNMLDNSDYLSFVRQLLGL